MFSSSSTFSFWFGNDIHAKYDDIMTLPLIEGSFFARSFDAKSPGGRYGGVAANSRTQSEYTGGAENNES